MQVQSDPDREILKAILDGDGGDLDPALYPGGQRQLIHAYRYLLERVASTFGREVPLIRDLAGYISQNVFLVRIETATFRSALQIFETVNDTGVNLTPIDLVKNHLFVLVPASSKEKLRSKWMTLLEHLESASAGNRQSTGSTTISEVFRDVALRN